MDNKILQSIKVVVLFVASIWALLVIASGISYFVTKKSQDLSFLKSLFFIVSDDRSDYDVFNKKVEAFVSNNRRQLKTICKTPENYCMATLDITNDIQQKNCVDEINKGNTFLYSDFNNSIEPFKTAGEYCGDDLKLTMDISDSTTSSADKTLVASCMVDTKKYFDNVDILKECADRLQNADNAMLDRDTQ